MVCLPPPSQCSLSQWLDKYRVSHNESDLNQAWELYYHVFRRINKQLPQLTALELQYVSPKLLEAQNLKLAVPGTYMATYNQVRAHLMYRC